ncbi:MAG: extracellular solute-binding protein [Sneathiellaceae bacterium]
MISQSLSRSQTLSRALSLALGAIVGLAGLSWQDAAAQQPDPAPTHALSLIGKPKYGPGFTHLDYVNEAAPKGGRLRLHAIGGFDSLHPLLPRGEPAPGLGLVYETLMSSPLDDVSAEYGLIAESVTVPEDLSWASFTLRPEARWHDGTPVTADDVVFTFDKIKSEGDPSLRFYYANVDKAEKLGPHEVKFHFSGPRNRELPQIMGQLPVLQKAWWEADDRFSRTTLAPWPGSGPYRIKTVDANRSIAFERVPDYWGAGLPLNVGRNNFDEIVYDMYRDSTVALEAFKSDRYDYRTETTARVWAQDYDFPARQRGDVVLDTVETERPSGLVGFIFNLRREKFQDPRVREAIARAFDFEWMNKNYFFGQYHRTDSYFENSELAATGAPSAAELAFLEPLRDQVPEEVFGPAYTAPESDGSGRDRRQLRQATKLLQDAGWTVQGGKLVGPDGKQMRIEFLLVQPAFERIAAAYADNLQRLGIAVDLRTVDSSQYINRLRSFDYDMIYAGWGQSESPGNEQRSFFSSDAADDPSSRNYAGITDPAVDKLIDNVIFAEDRETLVAATRALDRVLGWNWYVVPGWNLQADRIAYWNRFGRPETSPAYGVDILAWWIDRAKAAALKGAE